MAEKKFWQRQTGESKVAYSAFSLYLENRDLEKVATQCSKPVSEIERWAEKYSWEDRADVYDFEMADNEQNSAEQDYKAMLDFQIGLGKMLQAKGAKTIKDSALTDEKTALALKMVTSGVEIERSARKAKRNALRSG